MKRTVLISSVFSLLVAALALAPLPIAAQRGSRLQAETVNGRSTVAGEVLVRFRDNLPAAAALAALRGDVDAAAARAVGRHGAILVRSRSQSTAQLVARLSRRPDVAYAEPNYILKLTATPDDELYPELWGMDSIQAPAAWDQSVGSTDNVVAILDTGIDYTHPDLAANVWTAPSPFTVTVDGRPITCAAGTHGFNAILRTCDPMDDHYHGTHVAGTIGAVGNNGIGVAGVNWTARIMGLKFFDADGNATMADAIASVEFAIAVKQAFAGTGGANIRVLSNSWGGPEFSQALHDEMAAAGDEDMLVVGGAGNDGTDNDVLPFYPANFDLPNVISVAATTFGDGLAFFSNYGATSVDLAAPGDFILSTTPGNDYQYLSGTSMATPHVSGAAALVLSRCALDTASLKETLLGTVDRLPDLDGLMVTGGRLNVNSALHACTGPPEIPVLKARGGDGRVTLTWPAALGAIRYNVKRSLTSGGPYSPLASDLQATTYVDLAVVNGTTYYYVVSAENALGESGDSNEASATPAIPSDLTVSSFTAPAAGSENSAIAITVTTRNLGPGTAAPSTTRFYLSADTTVDALDTELSPPQAVPQLSPNAESSAALSLVIPAGVPTGKHYVIAQADADDILDESSETNNRMSRSIQIGPDLTFSIFSVPSAGGAGSVISVTDTVINQGGGSAPATTTTFHLSANGTVGAGDVLLGSRPVPSLAAGAVNTAITALTIPSNTVAGTYFILATADANAIVPETSELNNVLGRIIQLGGDLIVSSLTAPANGSAGGSVTITDTTKNIGGGTVAASSTRFYLSMNSAYDAADTPLGSRAVPSLAPAATSTASTTVTIPAGTASGAYYLLAVADGDAAVPETYETNNTGVRVFQIGSDLIVSALTVPAQGTAGGSISITDTTTNQGTGLSSASVTRFYLSSNALLDAGDQPMTPVRQVPELAGGAGSSGSTTVTIPAGIVSGTYYVIAKADADNAVVETSETNNTFVRAIQIGGDLVVSAFTVPARGGAGLTVTVTDTTTNQGGSPVGPTTTKIYWSSNVTYDAGDTLLGTRGVPGLAAGASNTGSTNVAIPQGAATGTQYILAVADAENAAVETQEANNTLARTILIGPDLWVTTVTAPTKGAAGSSIVVTETTANQGGGDAGASVTKFYLSADGSIGAGDILLDGSRTVPALAPGASSTASTTVTIPAGSPAGTLWLIAQADGDGAVAETLETNQTRARSISIGPDLAVSTMTVGASTVPAGGVVSVSDTVTNQGADAAAPSVTRFYLSKNLLLDAGDIPIAATRSVPQIAANGSSTGTTSVTIPLSAPPDSYFLLAVADGNNVVSESLETNNATVRPIQVTPAP